DPGTLYCEATGRNRLRRPGDGAGAAGALWLATREVAQVRAIELPGVQLLDRRVGIGERPLRDAQEVERPVEVPSFRRAADETVASLASETEASRPAADPSSFPSTYTVSVRACRSASTTAWCHRPSFTVTWLSAVAEAPRPLTWNDSFPASP